MSQFAFYMKGLAAAGVVGRLGILLAWDPADRGAGAADDTDISNIGLYSWVGTWYGMAAAASVIKTKAPKQIPAAGCPVHLDGGMGHDYVVKFVAKSGGTGASTIFDCSLDVFENSTQIYGIAPATSPMKVELADNSFGNASELSFQDRMTLQPWEDPPEGDFFTSIFLGGGIDSKELWRALMTPGLPISWGL